MGTVHQLIAERGKQGVLELGFSRVEVEAAAAVLGDEDGGSGFLYSRWCQAALPHKRLPDFEGWQVESERASLIVQPGMKIGPAGKPIPVGVPFGSRARLILIYLQSEAVRTRSREIELGGSLREWLGKMGIRPGGTAIAAVRDQAERLAHCKISLEVNLGSKSGLLNQTVVDSAMFAPDDTEADGRGTRFLEHAKLSDGFYEQLQRHPVPLDEAAIRGVTNNSAALDCYTWLAYRLHSLKAPKPVTWAALRAQFGAGLGGAITSGPNSETPSDSH